jgi:hypothetical protein
MDILMASFSFKAFCQGVQDAYHFRALRHWLWFVKMRHNKPTERLKRAYADYNRDVEDCRLYPEGRSG